MQKLSQQAIAWTKQYFESTGGDYAIIGISGGVDSTVTAALCAAALGKDRVIGAILPNGAIQMNHEDTNLSLDICKYLGIRYKLEDISDVYESVLGKMTNTNENMIINLPARIRMIMLYAIATLFSNPRVMNTCNLSENIVGYATKFGDAAGDVSILHNMTKTQVRQMGYELGLPREWVEKLPVDGLQPLDDQTRLGLTYNEIDVIIHYNPKISIEVAETQKDLYDFDKFLKVEKLYTTNKHKTESMPCFSVENI